jgi:hypothetical protein
LCVCVFFYLGGGGDDDDVDVAVHPCPFIVVLCWHDGHLKMNRLHVCVCVAADLGDEELGRTGGVPKVCVVSAAVDMFPPQPYIFRNYELSPDAFAKSGGYPFVGGCQWGWVSMWGWRKGDGHHFVCSWQPTALSPHLTSYIHRLSHWLLPSITANFLQWGPLPLLLLSECSHHVGTSSPFPPHFHPAPEFLGTSKVRAALVQSIHLL